ncbi:MAG: NfeD family protein [Pseudomonadota bacterium]
MDGGFDYWHWLAFGVALMVLEMLAPSTYFLWMGLAGVTVGLVMLLAPGIGWELQIILFAVFSIVAIGLGRRYVKRHPIETDRPTLNVRGAQNLGRILTLETPIVNGVGRTRLDDTLWKVVGPDLPAGSQVEVIGVEGTSLRIRPLATPGDTVQTAGGTSLAEPQSDSRGATDSD